MTTKSGNCSKCDKTTTALVHDELEGSLCFECANSWSARKEREMENELKQLMQLAFRDGKLYGNATENGAAVWSPETRECYRTLVAAWNARAGAVDAGEVERLVDAYGQARADAEAYQVDATAQVAIKARAALIEYVTGKGERNETT